MNPPVDLSRPAAFISEMTSWKHVSAPATVLTPEGRRQASGSLAHASGHGMSAGVVAATPPPRQATPGSTPTSSSRRAVSHLRSSEARTIRAGKSVMGWRPLLPIRRNARRPKTCAVLQRTAAYLDGRRDDSGTHSHDDRRVDPGTLLSRRVARGWVTMTPPEAECRNDRSPMCDGGGGWERCAVIRPFPESW
jgi:hypothetical protein